MATGVGSAQSAPAQPGEPQGAPTSATQASPAIALRDLAGKRRLAGRAEDLKALADALDRNINSDQWAGVNLFSAFLQEDSVERPTFVWIERSLDIVTQVLFFAPIAVTWLGLMKATEAYRQTLHLRATAGEPFLAGWQSGFAGHLSKLFYLDRIALDVVILIVLLVVLLAAQFFYHARADEDNPAELFRELARALTAAERGLAPLRVSAPGKAAAQLNEAAAAFSETATTIREVGEIAGRMQAEAANGLKVVASALGKVELAAEAAKAAVGGVDQATQAMEKRLASVDAKTSEIVTAGKELLQKIGDTGERLGGSVDGLAKGLKDSVQDSQKRMSAAVEDSQKKVAAAVEDSQRKISAAVEDSQKSAAAAVGDSSTKIASALDAGSTQIRSALTEVSVAGSAYTHRVEQAADVLGQAGDAVDNIPAAVSELKTSVAELGARVSDLGTAVSQAKATLPTPADIPADLRTALDDLRAAATALQAASATLQATAGIARTAPPPVYPSSPPVGVPLGTRRWVHWLLFGRRSAP